MYAFAPYIAAILPVCISGKPTQPCLGSFFDIGHIMRGLLKLFFFNASALNCPTRAGSLEEIGKTSDCVQPKPNDYFVITDSLAFIVT